jgi:hypothetical protein
MQWDLMWRLYRPLRGLPCDVRQRKVLDIAINGVLGALSMHAVPPTIRTVVVPAGVTVLLGLQNSPHSCTGIVGPSLPYFTMATCVDSLLCYRSIRNLSLSFMTVPMSKVRIYISHIYILVVSLLPRLGEPLVHSLELWFLYVCVYYLPIT